MKKKSLKLLCTSLIISMMGGVFVGCSGKGESNGSSAGENIRVSISGSTSVGPLMEKVAEKYEAENSNVSIEINQVGSSAGIKDAINGVSEIGMSSRKLKDEEEDEVKGSVIAYDGIALITNKNNKVTNITMGQIKDIYTGKITNWKDIGGVDAPIVVVSREDGSGTRDAFQEIVGYKSENLISNATISDGNGNVKTIVEGNENAIGFVSFEYLDDKVGQLTVDGVKPEANLVKSGEYKLSRPFILATKEGNITENGKKIVEYILSDAGQKIVEENKLITVK
ncbi:phosphate ABC transporter substrate-binding protein [Clostridium septicum]|uniref:phosphate ABC transporter substrate-binding protein n=1 Tax=Clostridium septicum TaxID=1504 RepID=UPI003216F450